MKRTRKSITEIPKEDTDLPENRNKRAKTTEEADSSLHQLELPNPSSIDSDSYQGSTDDTNQEINHDGRNCPYLDTVNRGLLDFDFEKKCSVTLLTSNIYACLVCGKYFQGRSFNTPAFAHSLEEDHHVFINMSTRKIFSLPENYEVIDSSLDDIKINVNPILSENEMKNIDKQVISGRTLDNREYICGVVGINDLNAGDHTNSILQSLSHLPALRNYFLNPKNYEYDDKPASELISRFGILIRKIWNPHGWRSTVSPHELLQEVSLRSDKKFSMGLKGDPLEFYSWVINTLHRDLIAARKKQGIPVASKDKDTSIITELFQGKVQIKSEKTKRRLKESATNSDSNTMQVDSSEPKYETYLEESTKITPFFYLQFDLPVVTLLKDEKSKSSTSQIPIYNLLSKYDGRTTQYVPQTKETKTFIITRLPKYLVFFVKRFTQNLYLKEKNKTIVNFPVDDLDMREYSTEEAIKQVGGNTKYNLRAYVSHFGEVDNGTVSARFHHMANDKWYNAQDVLVEPILPEDHFVAEAYIMFYERND